MDAMNEMEYAVVDHKGDPVYHDETAIGAFNWAEVNLADDRYTVELMDKPSEPKTTPEQAAAAFIDAAKDLSRRRRLVVEPSLHIPRSKLKRISDRALARYLAAAKELEPTGQTSLNAEQVDKKHNHYFKDVSHLDEIDVYQVLRLFSVTDPCLQHIVKKALCAGMRGAKDFAKDVQEIADTANRLLIIEELDGKHNP